MTVEDHILAKTSLQEDRVQFRYLSQQDKSKHQQTEIVNTKHIHVKTFINSKLQSETTTFILF